MGAPVVFFLAGLWLYSRHHHFPFYYHPDEPAKVAQIRDGTRNFHHPLLLLTATDVARRFVSRDLDCQMIAEIGRWCSAFFAATAVAAFSWLGFNRFGIRGGVAAGSIMLCQRRPYELAHFMKEDCALLAGIALTLVAMETFWRRPSMVRAVLLGAATGLAASGKYIGFVMLLPALAIVFARRTIFALPVIAAFIIVIALVNYPAVISPSSLMNGVGYELAHLNSHFGIEVRVSHFGWVAWFLEVSPILLIFFAAYLFLSIRDWRSRSLPELILAAFPLGFGLFLSFSSKQAGRYALPMTEVAALLGVFGALQLWEQSGARQMRSAQNWLLALLACAGLYDLGRTALLDRGFQRDHRRELVEFITRNLPPATTIALDERVGLPAEIPAQRPQRYCSIPSPVSQKLRMSLFVADLGPLEQLRAEGVTHVAVAEGRYAGLLDEDRFATSGAEKTFARRRDFYRRLFAEGNLVWSRTTGKVGTLNPALRLYDITAASKSP